MVMILEAGVVADAVASRSSSPAAGSDVGAASAQPSSCADRRLPRCVTVISEWKAPSGPHLVWVLAVEEITIAQACGWRRRSMSAESFREWLLEILDHYHRRGRALSRSQSAWPPPSSNSVTLLLPHTHVLTRGAALPPGAVIITTTATRRPAVVPTLWRLLPRRCTQ